MFIAPILSGAGMRIKVLEAAACGIPLLHSPLANLGVNFDEKEASICHNAKEFINAIEAKIGKTENELMTETKQARLRIEHNFSNVSFLENAGALLTSL